MKVNIKMCVTYFLCKHRDIALDTCFLLNLKTTILGGKYIYVYIKSGELQFFIIKSYKNSIFKDFQQNFFFFFWLEIGRVDWKHKVFL